MGDIFSSHPYPGRKEIHPTTHHCDVCKKSFAYKDRAAHERSKKHRAALDKLKADTEAAEAAANGWTVSDGTGEADPNACHNCGKSGHMSRDCSEPKKLGACFNCGETGHNKLECPNPRAVICRNCNEKGHMSRNCEQPRSAVGVTCNNCSEVGHFSRECKKPKNWSKVICHQCGHAGHTVRRCNAEPADYIVKDESGFHQDDAAVPSASEDWMNNGSDTISAEPAAVEGDWMQGDASTADATAAGEDWGAAPTSAVQW